jgi:glycosyltransferase involved in cell wall biosynthesis
VILVSSEVVFAMTGDVGRNSRALRQLRALQGAGYRVKVLSLGADDPAPLREEGFQVQSLAIPTGRGIRFFAGVHRHFRAAALRLPAHIYHASDLYVLGAMHAAARRHGAALVYDARELYAHVSATTGRPWVSWGWQQVEGRFIRHAHLVLTVSDSIADHLARQYRIPPPLVLYNTPPLQAVARTSLLRDWLGITPGMVLVLHQGQLRAQRGCERLVAAMPSVERAVLVFLGDGPLRPTLEQQARQLQVQDRVRFLDPVSPDALLPVTASADIGVTLLEDTCLNHRYALPNKLFEYLMAGLPVLASDLPELRRVVTGYGVGCVVDPQDAQALATALQAIVDDAGARSQWSRNIPAALHAYGWEQTAPRFIERYRKLSTGRS